MGSKDRRNKSLSPSPLDTLRRALDQLARRLFPRPALQPVPVRPPLRRR